VLIDTHVHLDDNRYDPDRAALVQRAKDAGVGVLISIGTQLDDSRWATEYAGTNSDVYATVGLHPEMADRWDASQMDAYEALARRPKVVAIGEVGMDFHRPEFKLEQQEPVFRAFIRLARKLSLPLVIHNRAADADTLRILKDEWDPALGGLFHCFAGDYATAHAAVAMNFDLAVGGVLTFKNAQSLRDIIATIPLERLVLETDGPWLAPQKWRGQRNEPAFVTAVAETLAAVKGVSLAEVEAATTRNAKRVFKLKD
jgi:TatD DNase family protein